MSKRRKSRCPIFVMRPSRCLPAVEFCRGVSPIISYDPGYDIGLANGNRSLSIPSPFILYKPFSSSIQPSAPV